MTKAHLLLAERLREILGARRLSDAEVARWVGMTQQKFSRKMNGTTPFTVDELYLVADALGVPVEELVAEVARRGPTVAGRTYRLDREQP